METGHRPTLLIVTDVRLYREFLITLVQTQLPAIDTGVTSSGAEGMQRLIACGADAVLLDLRCHDSHRMLKTIGTFSPSARLVAFAVHDDDSEILACAEAGVSAYVPSDASVEELVASIQTALRGDQHLPPWVAASLFRRLAARSDGVSPDAAARVGLSARERQVLWLVVQGLTNKEIATRLQIEVATVKNHVHNVLIKLRVKSRAEAATCVIDGSRSFDAHLGTGS